MSMLRHVNHKCRKDYYELIKIRQIKKYLDDQSLESVIHSFVTTHMDFCNSLLYGCPQKITNKFQKLQNCAARVLKNIPRFDHITPVLKELHWLPITSRIQYKIALLTFKCLHKQAPEYLVDLIEKYEPTRNLRSSSSNLLRLPKTNTKSFGTRAFTYAAPFVWNNLPDTVRNQENIDQFKRLLKTHLFSIAYK
jgi:hypothetical protein